MARRSPQTRAKLDRERLKREKRERKQEKKAAAAEARSQQALPPRGEGESEDPSQGSPG